MAITEQSNQIGTEEFEHVVNHLPKSAREIFRVLKQNGALKPQEIGSYTTLSHRTIRYALKILVDHEYIQRVPDLHDLRSHFYTIN
ncbi:MarR family transcriptional regulator [Candidatus Hodarchaeum mangrovi]